MMSWAPNTALGSRWFQEHQRERERWGDLVCIERFETGGSGGGVCHRNLGPEAWLAALHLEGVEFNAHPPVGGPGSDVCS